MRLDDAEALQVPGIGEPADQAENAGAARHPHDLCELAIAGKPRCCL